MSITITKEAIEMCGGLREVNIAFDALFTNSSGRTINGHYWVERDGVVIDPYFSNYDAFKSHYKIKNKKAKRVYVEATNPITRMVAMKFLEERLMKPFNDREKAIELMRLCCYSPEPRCCAFNSIMEQVRNGGEIKFGSVGMNTDDGKKTIWIYGNKNYNTIADFAAYDDEDTRITNN